MGPEVSIPVSPGHYRVLLCPGYKIQPGTHGKNKLPGREGTGERASMPGCEEPYVWAVGRRGKGGISLMGDQRLLVAWIGKMEAGAVLRQW